MTGQPAVAVEAISVGYGGAPVVREVSLHAMPGNVATILGPNGAGKSTLVKSAAGLLKPTGGTVWLTGKDVTGFDASRLARLGMAYVPQHGDVFPPMTVRENLEIGGYLLARDEVRRRIDARVEEFPQLARLMGRTAGSLSGGERKLVGIVRAMMSESRVLLLDEPTAALSPSVAEMILQTAVRAIADRGVSILMVEQRAQLAMSVSDWVYILIEGQLAVSQGPTELAARDDFLEILAGIPPEILARSDA